MTQEPDETTPLQLCCPICAKDVALILAEFKKNILKRTDKLKINEKINSYDQLKETSERYRVALERIKKVSQFDHPKSQIIGSEEYEGAWLDCVEIANTALSETPAEEK